MAALSHRMPLPAGMLRDSCRAQRNDKTNTLCTVFQLIMLCSHSCTVSNSVPFNVAEETLNMDSIAACLSAAESNPNIGTVSTAQV
jgi:hypothetical protein